MVYGYMVPMILVYGNIFIQYWQSGLSEFSNEDSDKYSVALVPGVIFQPDCP